MSDQPSAHHRRDGEGNDAGDHDRDAYSDGKFAEQAPDDAGHQQDGMKTAISEIVIEMTVKVTSRAPSMAA